MLNTTILSFPTFSKQPLDFLYHADTYSLSSTNKTPFHTNTKSNATASPFQTFHQTHTAPNISPSASLPSSSSVANGNPIKPHLVKTQNNTLSSVAINNSVGTFDGPDHQCTPEGNICQIDAHMVVFVENNLSIV